MTVKPPLKRLVASILILGFLLFPPGPIGSIQSAEASSTTGLRKLISKQKKQIRTLKKQIGALGAKNRTAQTDLADLQQDFETLGDQLADTDELLTNTLARLNVVEAIPFGFREIPGGTFIMGRTSADSDSFSDAQAPATQVTVSTFYMAEMETSVAKWQEVRAWGLSNGYTDLAIGSGHGPHHPVHTVTWFDVVKWCNARSEMEGLTPVYTVGGNPMRQGTTEPVFNTNANGYRLPTEAEWERAARGDLVGLRFPWGDTISHTNANFWNGGSESYKSGTSLFHPSYSPGAGTPYTNPVGDFDWNGYGLKNMIGNVSEWCWDWYGGSYYSSINGATDPRGPASGTYRVRRGGSWLDTASEQRTFNRQSWAPDTDPRNWLGFRVVRNSIL